MKLILQRYIAASFVGPFMISCIFFVCFLLSFSLFNLTNLVVNKGLSLSFTLVLLGHTAVTFLPMAFPISSLFASLYSIGKFSRDSEYIAMRSFGLSKDKLYLPYAVISLFIAMMILVLNMKLIPLSQVSFNNLVRSLESSQFLADIKEGRFFTAIPNVTIFSEKVSKKGTELGNIFIHIDEPLKKSERAIFSEHGNTLKMRDFESSSESLRLILEKGNISHIENGGEKLQKILFQKYDFPVTQGSFRPHFQVKPSMMDSGQLWGIMTMESAEALKLGFDKNYIEKIKFEFWNRINTPFLCMIFTFLGVSIGVQDNRGKKKNVGSMSLFFLVVYYSIFFALVTLSRSTILPAFMAVFIPTIMTFFYSLNHYKKLNWFGN